MPRKCRAASFLLEPSRWKNDPAVLMMTEEARGCYAMLFMEAWDQKEPGVYPADDRVLTALARTSPDVWARVRKQVAAAFDLATPGEWRLPGMIAAHNVQTKRFARRKEAGSKGGNAKRDNRIASIATLNVVANAYRLGSGLGSGSGTGEVKEEKPKRERRRAPRATPPPRTVSDRVVGELEAQYPDLDVAAVRDDLLASLRAYADWDLALRNWCRLRNTDGRNRRNAGPRDVLAYAREMDAIDAERVSGTASKA